MATQHDAVPGSRTNVAEASAEELVRTVDRFLQLCEARRLEEAATLLAPNVVLVFPGDVRYRSLEEMVAAAGNRYRKLEKHRTSYLVGHRMEDRLATVVSMGTLQGIGADGTPFEGVRYTDLFVLREGLIAEQYVFNDLAEVGVVRPGAGRR